MLEYKITSVELVMYTLTDPILLVIMVLIYLVFGYFLFKIKSKKIRIIILIILIALPILYILPILVKTSLGWHWYGYELYDHKLHIKAWPVDEIIDLNDSEVFLTKSKEWRPKIRILGMGIHEIGMGYFKLENGIKAVVFKHKNSEEFVVINASGYYVIIHPGVDKLYKEIIKIKGEEK